ncbi:MAG: hypothetical protein HY907_23070 [Deltaproteobacteria bacterium]|nr:hypothetical protein [Deltaproteobacteria bacterium]
MGRVARIVSIVSTVVLLAGCEEIYTECRPERAPSDFPPASDTAARCAAVCAHFDSLGCRLGCPYLPDGGLDAGGVQVTALDCLEACATAAAAPDVPAAALDAVLRCYAGTETCLQVGACSRLCGDSAGPVWTVPVNCVEPTP